MRKVLSVASECVPLIKTGGLADVVGALPAALAPEGWEMRVLIPAYRGVLDKLKDIKQVWAEDDLFGGPGRVLAGRHGRLDVLVLEAPHLFDRAGGPYSVEGRDFGDNAERFAALSHAAASIARDGDAEGWRPEVLHAHDWQTGLAPAYLRWHGGAERVASLMTIHNIAFQGHARPDRLGALRLPPESFNADGVEYWGNISTLKAGLTCADAITTVSPRYADELMRGEFGLGLEGVIAARAGQLHGILNGIDTEIWNPETDTSITPFSARKTSGKAKNRKALLKEFGLGDVPGPLAVLISRLTPQKGIDLVAEAAGDFVAQGGGLCVLGSGDAWAEEAMRGLAGYFPERVGVRIGYDEDLSHLMFAGGDAVLVPSRFEPCGLTQLYGLRYGTIPVVAATGGLADTVIGATPATLAAGAATGVVFHPVDTLALRQALRKLVALHADTPTWKAMVRRAMAADFGWAASAARYARLYESIAR
ncbi:glycogen synthase GlgA [Phaeovulum vinaykumarii]|uniref:Glycogen synthase n=1 Tax=Phaeovulum vinaykumarii TaxID=407234 RepID=A0A1N7LID3_9RHOB|nr:glycogen synthase GlgA [Phaeovulum vinaykumarii]SIS73572.1 starch synthase [Phaeovulum vinaykumarii]SOC04715.1 starch synthase [Phaeovulum vinaykumarii]